MTQSFTQSNVKIGWRPYVSPVPSTILLDLYSGAAVAYSLRKLKSSYTGFAIRVRRSSDNTEQNIGFDTNGNLDTSSMLSFVGAGNGFVTTWYDQSGNNKNAIQTTAAGQPQIVNTGSIITLGSKPAISWDGSNDTLVTSSAVTSVSGLTTMGIISVVKPNAQSLDHGRYAHLFFPESGGWGEVYHFASSGGVVSYRFGTGAAANTPSYTTSFTGTTYNNLIMSTYKNGSNEITRVNGKDAIVFNNKSATLANTTNTLYLGYGEFNSYFGGRQSEVIIYTTNKVEERAAIESNINSYYTIFDNDAEAFIDAAIITGNSANVIRTLVTSLKSASIWTKMKAIYPFVGGTATKHKLNLKDPRDLDVAYRLTFNGGWSYWNEGPQSSYGTAQTYLNPATVFGATNSVSLGVYQSGGLNGSGHGAWSHSGTRRMAIFESGGGFIRSQITSASTEAVSPDMRGVTNGFLIANRNSATSNKIWRHGVLQGSNTVTETSLLPDANITLCNVNGNVNSGYVNAILYFAYIAEGLTDTQVSTMHTLVQTFRVSYGYYI